MLTIKHDLRDDTQCKDGVTIRHLADLHIGSPNCDVSMIKRLVAENVENHWFCFLGGDILDVGLKDSKSDCYTQTMTVNDALNKAYKLLKPLADAGLILGAVQGNHEARLTRASGLDLTYQLMCRFGLEDLYNPHAVLAVLRVGKRRDALRKTKKKQERRDIAFCYVVHLTHGHAGGTTPGGRSNALVKARLKIDADVYLQGHTHHSEVLLGSCLRVNRSSASVSQIEQVFVCCGSCLTYDDSYGETMNLAPSDNRFPHVFLSGTEHHVEATL